MCIRDSRRSVDNHRGAADTFFVGQVRSGTSMGSKAVYRPNGIGLGCCTGTGCDRVPKLVVVMGFLAVCVRAYRRIENSAARRPDRFR